jgi:hypothetical protein
MWKVRSHSMIFTAILNKAAKSARRFQVAGLHSGIDVPHPDGRCRALRKPLQHPTSSQPSRRIAGNSNRCIAFLLEVGVQRARMSTNGYGGLQSGADGRKVAGDA